jgi:hypothetical protein
MVCGLMIAMLRGRGTFEPFDTRIGAGMQLAEFTAAEIPFAHIVTRDVGISVVQRSASPTWSTCRIKGSLAGGDASGA